MATIVLLGTLDTKGIEYDFLRDRLMEAGVEVTLIDAGVIGEPKATPDITREEVARAAGEDVEALASAVAAMARGAGEIARNLHDEERLDGILAVGGSGGSALATRTTRVCLSGCRN